ncbi:hypothetical protein LTR70_004803 [Exophiala xenobiotica]|uniref:Sucrase n=1 Tax=Lithohypha guttulata TaxID=1690604 RepID=A0ABR0KEC1_9EURO|nr:hypothetical protein LTR24_004295 [Lithohypha guttulata]KAK5319893.1 hypothetical protein LTR70_004803 [Exophiala xenobiotica]
MQKFIAKTRTLLTPTSSSANIHEAASGEFRKEKDASSLFPKTDPKVDGEDCLHDCASCVESLPRKWEIDEEDELYGYVKGWETHLVIGTGKADWVRDVTEENGSLMQAVGNLGVELSNGKLMLSASDMPTSSDHGTIHEAWGSTEGKKGAVYANEGKTQCLLLPRWEMVEGVGINEAKWLLDDVVSKSSTNSTPLSKEPATRTQAVESSRPTQGQMVVQKEEERDADDIPDPSGLSLHEKSQSQNNGTENRSPNGLDKILTTHESPIPPSVPAGVTMKPCPHKAVILMCSHGTRDWRCGKSAPILRREFERHLRPLGLFRDFDDERPGGVGVYFINHVGGHKYSANVMIYRREGRDEKGGIELSNEAVQGIWLARVRPEDCENIVKYTVLQGKLVKPQRQLRGGFDRERGVLSW